MLQNLNPLYVVLSCLLALGVVGGLLMQARAIVQQSKSIAGVPVKFAALAGFLGVLSQVRANPVPYVIVFVVTAIVALTGALLARQARLR